MAFTRQETTCGFLSGSRARERERAFCASEAGKEREEDRGVKIPLQRVHEGVERVVQRTRFNVFR